MKRQDLSAMRQKTPAALREEIKKLELLLVNTRIKRGLGQVKNVHTEIAARKDIARLKTIIREVELGAKMSVSPKATLTDKPKKQKTEKTSTTNNTKKEKKDTK